MSISQSLDRPALPARSSNMANVISMMIVGAHGAKLARRAVLHLLSSVAALLLGACTASALAETPRWYPIGPHGADGDVALAADPGQPGRVYAATRRDVYVSLDGGAHFAALPGFLGSPVYGTQARSLAVLRSAVEPAVYPAPPPQLLVGTQSGGVYFSADGGRTFQRGVFVNEEAALVATIWDIYPARGSRDVAYLYAGQSLYRTTDGGASWRRVATPANVGSDWSLRLAVLDDDGNVLLLCRADGIFRSGDGGGTWAPVAAGLPPAPYPYTYAYPARDVARPGVAFIVIPTVGTYRSDDGGIAWTQTGTGIPANGSESLLARNGVLLFGDGRRLLRSADGGQTWTLAFTGGESHSNSVALDTEPSRVYVSGFNNSSSDVSGVWISDDAGATWQSPGAVGIADTRINFVLVDAAGVVYAKRTFPPGRLYARGDGEQVWRDIRPAAYINTNDTPIGYAPEDLVLLGAGSLLARGQDTTLYRSDDGGRDWENLGIATPVTIVAAEPGQPDVLYGLVYVRSGRAPTVTTAPTRSLDGGRSWQSINGGLPAVTYRLIAGGGNRLFAITSDGCWASANGGTQWARTTWAGATLPATPLDPRSVAADMQDPGILYAVTAGGVFRSDDAGAHYVPIGPLPAPDAKFIAVAADVSRTIYVATYPQVQVYASRDRGATWVSVGEPLLDWTEVTQIVASPTSPSTLYAASDRGVLQFVARPDVARAVEYYHPGFDHYFVTADRDEAEMLDVGSLPPWMPTGETWSVLDTAASTSSPVCRFFSTAFAPKSSHFYTPFADECAKVRTYPEWQFEAYAFFLELPAGFGSGAGVCRNGTLPLYRLYNNGMGGAPNHRYTTSRATFDRMISAGWVFEGEATTKVFACVPAQ